MLRLESISKVADGSTQLYAMNVSLIPGEVNVLLGATLAGKTSLLRIMAGLDPPSSGRLLSGDRDVTGVPVRERNLAMVYQQFINYPSLTVYENIASPLRLQRRSANDIRDRVGEIADSLHLTAFLKHLPAELSGGQQQRTALARALAKDAELLLLDEPLVNLDYKLREELRVELAELFRNRKTTVVYATTEPQEALQLGGQAFVLHEGRLLQSGRTIEVFQRPTSIASARAFSDPPMNLFDTQKFSLRSERGAYTIGVRPHHLRVARANAGDIDLQCQIELAEISGSDTYLHVLHRRTPFVAQLRGVHEFSIGASCALYFSPKDSYGFDSEGQFVFAPEHS